MSDIETLKAWCHWRRKMFERGELLDDEDFVKAIEDVISQVGTWKSKFERVQAERDRLAKVVELYREALEFIANEVCCDSGMMLCCSAHEDRARQALQKGREILGEKKD